MLSTGGPPTFLDLPTLAFVSIALAGLLGLFLLLCWMQERDVRPLAWWGSAYLIGAASMALWLMPQPRLPVPREVPEAMTLLACGVVWSGIRLFYGRELRPLAALAGAIVWPVFCAMPGVGEGGNARVTLAALLVAAYTFLIACELRRERRKSRGSRAAGVIVPCLHAAIFILPLVMQRAIPAETAPQWVTVFVLETIIYAVGTAFIVLLLVKDHHLYVYRRAATTDHLTGLPNRRAFLQGAADLCARQARKREPVTLMMFDLDHFKSINDRFGHATGDEALKVFAGVLNTGMRTDDIIGRFGGEEFAVIVPGHIDIAEKIAERIRSGFEQAGQVIAGHVVHGTVSIGAAASRAPVADLDALINRADEALYVAKRSGRNRMCAAPEVAPDDTVVSLQRRAPAKRLAGPAAARTA